VVTDDKTIGRMSYACYIPKAADTHPDYVRVLFHNKTP